MTADVVDQPTGAGETLAADEIRAMRERIDEIDQAIIDLWLERARLSQQVGKTRMASGGTRLVLSREREIPDGLPKPSLHRREVARRGDSEVGLRQLVLRGGKHVLAFDRVHPV